MVQLLTREGTIVTFKIQTKQCDQCLFSRRRIVTAARFKNIIRDCTQLGNEKHFVCHKASLKGDSVCCRGFWDKYKNNFQLGQVAQRLNLVEEVEVL